VSAARALVALVAAAAVGGAPVAARAQGGKPGPAAPVARKVAVAPLGSLVDGGGELGAVQALVGGGAATVPGVSLVADKDLRAAIKKSKRKELEACERDVPCLVDLGKLVGATVFIAGEVGELGGGQVAYLTAIDVATGKEIGSTTAVLSGAADARQAEARAAAYRLLAPGLYVGTLALSVDVPGAVIYVDGKVVGRSPAAPITASVGTHALRVTHDKYRDFVRFVDVSFDAATKLDVNLKEFPVVADEMVEKGRKAPVPTGPVAPRPWYREWWAVAGAGGVLLVGTIVITAIAGSGVDADREVTVEPPK
jgi:hypothetical protein